MMRIALITLHTPTATNCRGASALPFHLLKFRPAGRDVRVWTFDLNCCLDTQRSISEPDLGLKISAIPFPRHFGRRTNAIGRLLQKRPALSYLRLPQAVINEIDDFLGTDGGVWIYGEDIAGLAREFGARRCVVTTPDCEAMYYYRLLAANGTPLSLTAIMKYSLMFHRYSAMAAGFPTEGVKYHLVGEEDAEFLKRLNPKADVCFVRHPHYAYRSRTLSVAAPLRLLIAGRYDVYMAKAVDEAIAAMAKRADQLKDLYFITFLGKGWDVPSMRLAEAGYSVEVKGFVDDYAEELCSHHMQLTPITVGTGTKGKVLDAFANGLMVIGTDRALENIAVEHGVSCVRYKYGHELTNWLLDLAADPRKVQSIAEAGREAVLKHHGRQKIADEFFALFE